MASFRCHISNTLGHGNTKHGVWIQLRKLVCCLYYLHCIFTLCPTFWRLTYFKWKHVPDDIFYIRRSKNRRSLNRWKVAYINRVSNVGHCSIYSDILGEYFALSFSVSLLTSLWRFCVQINWMFLTLYSWYRILQVLTKTENKVHKKYWFRCVGFKDVNTCRRCVIGTQCTACF